MPTVVDLNREEKAILGEEGDVSLEEHLRAKGCFPFPALKVSELAPSCRETMVTSNQSPAVRIYVPDDRNLQRLAARLGKEVRSRTGVTLPVLRDDEFRVSRSMLGNAVVLGGAHQSRAAALLADLFLSHADLVFPGEGGCLLKTVHNVLGTKRNIVQMCGDARDDSLVERFVGRLKQDREGGWYLPPTFEVGHGEPLKHELGTRASRLRELAKHFWPLGEEIPSRLDLPILAAAVCRRYDSGGKKKDLYNLAPLWMAAQVGELYCLTADRALLDLFKRLLWGCVDYHCNASGGASIISDFEFPLSYICAYWDLVEQDPIFSDEERLILTNFFYSSIEICKRYTDKFWPLAPGKHRHNHETFPALTLYFWARYFHTHYRLPGTKDWFDHARRCFSGPTEKSFKQTEDAAGYQWLVPLHKTMYDATTGTHRYLRSGNLEKAARNAIIAADNFGYPCDFGDAWAIFTGGGFTGDFLQTAAGLTGDAGLQWSADHLFRTVPKATRHFNRAPLLRLAGSKRVVGNKPRIAHQVEVFPLDDHIRKQFAPDFPRRLTFDKLALREGWTSESQYLLLDGYSAGSHYHHDQNAIIRYNQLGRVWLVDNGYGYRSGSTKAIDRWTTRELGPQDHNTLILTLPDGSIPNPPPFCALVTCEETRRWAFIQSDLNDYAGTDWRRSILWMKGSFVLVVDSVNVKAPLKSISCQWNMLGEMETPAPDGSLVRCSQRGVNLFVHSLPGPTVELSSYMNDSWELEFKEGPYRFAEPPVRKVNLVYSDVQPGQRVIFANLFHATRAKHAMLSLSAEGASEVRVTGDERRQRSVAQLATGVRIGFDEYGVFVRFGHNK